jgi:hypothetical protein
VSDSSALKMEPVRSSKISTNFYWLIWHNPNKEFLLGGCFLGLYFDPENRGKIFLRSVREFFNAEERDTNSKTSAHFYQTTWRHIKEDITVHTIVRTPAATKLSKAIPVAGRGGP